MKRKRFLAEVTTLAFGPWDFDPTEPRRLHVVRSLEEIDGSVTE